MEEFQTLHVDRCISVEESESDPAKKKINTTDGSFSVGWGGARDSLRGRGAGREGEGQGGRERGREGGSQFVQEIMVDGWIMRPLSKIVIMLY